MGERDLKCDSLCLSEDPKSGVIMNNARSMYWNKSGEKKNYPESAPLPQ
jgi:hypothetical protein